MGDLYFIIFPEFSEENITILSKNKVGDLYTVNFCNNDASSLNKSPNLSYQRCWHRCCKKWFVVWASMSLELDVGNVRNADWGNVFSYKFWVNCISSVFRVNHKSQICGLPKVGRKYDLPDIYRKYPKADFPIWVNHHSPQLWLVF